MRFSPKDPPLPLAVSKRHGELWIMRRVGRKSTSTLRSRYSEHKLYIFHLLFANSECRMAT
jgi:hypothetical protein